MLASQTAHIDSLQSPDAAVVLNLYTGEIPQGVGHRIGPQPLKLLSGKFLRRNNLSYPISCHDHLTEGILRHLRDSVLGPQHNRHRQQHRNNRQYNTSFPIIIHCQIIFLLPGIPMRQSRQNTSRHPAFRRF